MARSRNIIDVDELHLPAALDPDRLKGDQLREILESLAVRLGPGSPLPSERHLAELYGVARMTVRNEIRRLAEDGVLEIRRGSGAYVPKAPNPRMAVGFSFSRQMRQSNLDPGSVVVEHNVLMATTRLAAVLEVPTGTRVLRVVRVRTARGEPIGLERTTVSLERFPDLAGIDFSNASLYDSLRDLYGIEASRANAKASAILPSDEEAERLGITVEQPCLALTIVQRDREGQVIEAGRSVYRGDRYDLDLSYQPSS